MAPASNPGMGAWLPPPMFFLLRDRSQSFDAVGVYDGGRPLNLAGDAGGAPAERLAAHCISATAFQALGVKPLIGRLHEPDEDLVTAEPTIVLGHALWQRRFGGRPDVIGETALVDGQATAIIGVMPASFELFDGSSEAWTAFAFAPSAAQGSQHWLRAIGRLKPGVSLHQVTAEMGSVVAEYERLFPERGSWTLRLQPLHDAFFGYVRQPLVLLQVAVGIVLLIACANLAALMLTRSVGRQRELAVRCALGQSRASLMRLMLIESLLLSLGAGAVGAFVAWLALKPLVALTPAWFPRLDAVALDLVVFLFCLGVSVLASVVFGVLPAWQTSRPNFVRTLYEAGGRASSGPARLLQMQALVVVQVTLAFVLLVGAGLVINSLVRLQNVNLGVDTSGLLSLEVQLPRAQYITQNVGQAGGVSLVDYSPAAPLLFDRIHEAQAAGSNYLPLMGNMGVSVRLDGHEAAPERPTSSPYSMVTANYFETMKIRIVRGRDFTPQDHAGVAVVHPGQ